MGLLVGFGHRRRVGKDTAASFLMDAFGGETLRIGFADKLKEECFHLFEHAGLQDKAFYDANPDLREQKLENGWTPRQLWIAYGNMMRELDPDVWVWPVIAASCAAANVTIVPDVRYHNEAQAIQAAGGIVVKITRDSVPHSKDVADQTLANWTGWDGVIFNDGSLADLREAVARVVVPMISERRIAARINPGRDRRPIYDATHPPAAK